MCACIWENVVMLFLKQNIPKCLALSMRQDSEISFHKIGEIDCFGGFEEIVSENIWQMQTLFKRDD